jgi:hypothetical protein
LTSKLVAMGGLICGILGAMVIAPALYPRQPGEGFNFSQMLCAGVCGALGAVLGALVGSLIESMRK